jgi:hypothetical protein
MKKLNQARKKDEQKAGGSVSCKAYKNDAIKPGPVLQFIFRCLLHAFLGNYFAP